MLLWLRRSRKNPLFLTSVYTLQVGITQFPVPFEVSLYCLLKESVGMVSEKPGLATLRSNHFSQPYCAKKVFSRLFLKENLLNLDPAQI